MGSDSIEIGLTASFNRPTGNLTGVAVLSGEMAAKRLSLVRELVPAAKSIAVFVKTTNPLAEMRDLEAAARLLGLRMLILDAETENDIAAAFGTLVAQQAGALLIGSDTFFHATREQIISLADRYAVPALFYDSAAVADGGLSSYGPNLPNEFRQVGLYVTRILEGAKPANLPVLQPTKFELVINLETAKALGLTIPETLLATADVLIQ